MENISFQPSKKMYKKVSLVIATFSFLIVLAAIVIQLIVTSNGKMPAHEAATVVWSVATVIVLFKWIIALTISILWVKNLAYIIQEDRVIIYKGIITKVEQNIPFKAITDFMLHRSLYDRILGIGSIKLQTAGQSTQTPGYEGILSGLTDYPEIMSELKNRLNLSSGKHTPENEPAAGENYSEEILQELKKIRSLLEEKN